MTIIASHLRRDTYSPGQPWPDDCTVQWGGGGVVLTPDGSYVTAFFEAFPAVGGFIRGEGETIEAAEAKAWSLYRRERVCHESGGHQWSRNRRRRTKDGELLTDLYTNGGCFCMRCGSFRTVMPAIVILGSWREPLRATELHSVASGFCRVTDDHDRAQQVHARRLELRARLSGIAVPDWRDPAYADDIPYSFEPEENRYAAACRAAVLEFYAREHERLRAEPDYDSILGDVMGSWALRSLHRDAVAAGLIEDDIAGPPSPGL